MDLRKFFFAAILAAISASGSAVAQEGAEGCSQLEGAIVVNSDGEMLGRITNPYASDSIFNEYGQYGSPYRTGSIWNQYGKNGSEYRQGSAFNPYTSSPPTIIKAGRVIGYLSVNRSLRGALHPTIIAINCYGVEPPR